MENKLRTINNKRLIGELLFLSLFLYIPISVLAQNTTVTAPVKEEKTSLNHEPKGLSKIQRNRIIANIENNMVFVKGDTFQMGTNDIAMSHPIHDVFIDDFYIGKYEVTDEEWYAVLGKKANPTYYNAKQPVVGFDWDELENFIIILNKKTNCNFRLPTEAEWEWAAQGGVKSKHYKYAGSNDPYEIAGSTLLDVGSKKPNELGLYDMSGNVAEFCSDYFGPGIFKFQINPTGPSKKDVKPTQYGYEHVVKGDCWGPIQFSSHEFYKYRPQFRNKAIGSGNWIGFRLVLDVIPEGLNPQIYVSAKRGDINALKEVVKYYQQKGDSNNYLKWLERLGTLGELNALVQLGQEYLEGKIVSKDLAKAEHYLLSAYKRGNASAKTILGEVYKNLGLLYDKSEASEAFKWFEKGASLENAECQNNAGLYFFWGKGVEKNYSKAADYFLKSANQGYYYALNNIGTAYLNGYGVEKNLDKAEYWYRKAAEKGHPDAARMLKQLEKRIVTIVDGKNNEPLIGCTLIHYRNGKRLDARASDIEGQYSIRDIRPGDILRFEYVGYKSKEITLKCTDVPHTLTFSLASGKGKQTEYESRY